MRFGFGTVPAGPPQDTAALVAHAERLGFDVAWMPDQTFYRDPYITLAACVQHTSTITLGLGVTNPYTRHPAMTARAAATLAELCHGRFILGIGAGNRKELIEKIMFNQYQPLTSYFPGGPYENPNNPKNDYDPQQALKPRVFRVLVFITQISRQ